MINKVKDFLGIKRKISISVYGIGYLSNAFHVEDIEVYYSMKYINNFGICKLSLAHIGRKRINFPRMYCIVND